MADTVQAAAVPVPWHRAPWDRLQRSQQAGRGHHALLLEGLPGTGRAHFAQALAVHILCGDLSPDDSRSHKGRDLAVAGSHPDLRSIAPEEEGKSIGIDAIRSATGFVNATPSLGERKVLLINPAERLTLAAWNAFLKCLEEPAEGTVIIMVAARGHPLPATIRSRCQRIDLPAPTVDEAANWLAATLGEENVSSRGMERVMALYAIQPLKVAAYHQSDDLNAFADFLQCFDRAIAAGGVDTAMRLQAEAAAGRLDPDNLLEAVESSLVAWLRDRAASELRTGAGLRGFEALETVATLRRARRRGQNPNADLLRSSVVGALLMPVTL